MRILSIDFETYYSKTYSLSKMTTEEYINGDEFEVIGVAVKVDDGPTVWHTGAHDEIKQALESYDIKRTALLAHNTLFDGAILAFSFGLYPAKYLDTLSMARAIHGISVGGSLAKLANFYNLGVKGTEVIQALGKHRADFTPEKLEAYAGYCKNDVELTYNLFTELVPSFNMTELEIINLTIRMYTYPFLKVDLDKMEVYLEQVRQDKETLLNKVVADKADIMSNPKLAKILWQLNVPPPMKMSPTTGKMTYAFAKTDEEFLKLQEHDNPAVQALIAARLGVKSTIEETRAERYNGIGQRMGVLPVPLSYYGAATGRYTAAGGQATNFQNIPRESPIKEAITAPPGYVIVGADLSNIELRVGLWIAGEWEPLDILAKGGDLYKEFASAVFEIPYDKVNKTQRFIGKTSILSLIFGVSYVRLRESIRAGSTYDIGEAESKRIVTLYRDTYKNVVASWGQCDKAIKHIVADKEWTFGTNDIFKVEGKKGVRFPSGMYMQYPELSHTRDEQSGKTEYKYRLRTGYDRLYGSKLLNNLTQGSARCIMTEAMVRVSKRYPIVLTVHDALYILAPESKAQEAQDFLIGEMCKVPTWMQDLPLAAEGKYGKSLKDC
jgi:DNA polymerase I-like protein with 3'-5' exonuclease and polymerase domains